MHAFRIRLRQVPGKRDAARPERQVPRPGHALTYEMLKRHFFGTLTDRFGPALSHD